jgi:hypothetical protein
MAFEYINDINDIIVLSNPSVSSVPFALFPFLLDLSLLLPPTSDRLHFSYNNSITMASSYPNASAPFFARASKNSADGWSEVDNFDVDLLAEYLLDDGSLSANGVTFDFKYVPFMMCRYMLSCCNTIVKVV